VRTGPLFALSTASVYPESVAHGFEYAARLGYDAVEVMVSIDSISQDPAKVRRLRDYHEIPVCAVHAPCLLITQRVWGTDHWVKLERSAEMAHELDADVVVVHPPFRWQKEYAAGFVEGIADLERRTGIAFAVENMYPWRATSRREMDVYSPHWDPSQENYANTTIDLSHAATANSDPVAMAARLGDRLRHIHMTDGSGSAKDEHLVPGRGNQPCGEFLERLAATGFDGHIVMEINTRKSGSREAREADLLEALAFSRLHFAARPAVPQDQRSAAEPDLLG
jgi:sugar phosphate isomerase/epimerase